MSGANQPQKTTKAPEPRRARAHSNGSKRGKFFPELTVIPEVSLPTPLHATGKTPRQFEQQIQQWVDKQVTSFPSRMEVDSPPGKERRLTTEIVSQLTNQIYLDNEESLYILVTDVTCYVLNSKPEIWSEGNSNSTSSGESLGEEWHSNSNSNSDILFSCLFHVGEDIFVLFLFTPMDIDFLLELPPPPKEDHQGGEKMINVFFHGNSSVYVAHNGDGVVKSITIHFLEM